MPVDELEWDLCMRLLDRGHVAPERYPQTEDLTSGALEILGDALCHRSGGDEEFLREQFCGYF